MEPQEVLYRYWGYSSFRPLQKEIIDSVLEGKDTLAILPTGGGKSICFQVPAVMLEGLTIVISPLISLIYDQVDALQKRGIAANCLLGDMTTHEKEIILNHCLYGKTKILYITPERLHSSTFIAHLRSFKVSLIVVDEAHCISQWGYDFRPAYIDIAAIRPLHPTTPVLALTASATKVVVDDIQDKLLFKKKNVFQQSFMRTNISYVVLKEEDKIGRLSRIIKNVGGIGIVYLRNRKLTQEYALTLNSMGIRAIAYHAGLNNTEREKRQQLWMKEEVQVIVATNAFGMGIDKPNVRFVVHLDIPNSMEAYYQETGRAGRDGKPSYAIMLYNDNDLEHLDFAFQQSYPSIKYIKNVYKGICNYYQVPIGSGLDQQYNFAFEDICHSYGFDPLTFFSATNILEKEGLLAFPLYQTQISRLYIPITREEVYRFQMDHQNFGDILQILMRLYGGIFTNFVPIKEKDIAQRCNYTETEVGVMLQKMANLNIVDYHRKTDIPQIIFSSPRIDANNLSLNESNYKWLKDTAEKRKDFMKEYSVSQDTCRTKMILHYFGETLENECGTCDYCRNKKQEKVPSLPQTIIQHLSQKAMTIKELVSELGTINQDKIIQTVRELLDKDSLKMDKNGQLSC